MQGDQILTAINTVYIMGILLAIAFILLYIAMRLDHKSSKKSSKK
jgi:predicted outer membrane lipoprotein